MLLKQKNPEQVGVLSLRGGERNSNPIRLKIPIKITNSANRKTVVLINGLKAGDFFTSKLLVFLSKTRLFLKGKSAPKRPEKINYANLAAKYKNLIESGICKNMAEVARYCGVSRVWVTKVMRGREP